MLDFFLLEDMVRDTAFYEAALLPAIARLSRRTPQFDEGARGMLDGARGELLVARGGARA